ncbi:MAG TPA: NAD-dependent epimerase/dehydratase family protein [Solirubrobacterales bacterium]|nr:NAD-dependent epimerase/dehydratase family protein [Solirubrobacterales bacterium]
MRRVLVTGGSGFIGSHVVDKLAAAGFQPRIYDLRPSPHHQPGEVDETIGDLLDGETLREAMEDCEAVVHLAAYADVGVVADQPVPAEECNARGTLAVLEAARATRTRVLYGSTIWVYGNSGDGVIDEESPIGMPDHLYTASKLAGEMYCTSYAELYDVPCTILRFGIPYGPRARPSAVIPIFISKALEGEPLTIAGDGLQTRRFVYVEDLADGVVAAVERAGEDRIYNLAGDETVTIRELAEVVSDLVGDTEIEHTPGRNGDFGGAVISNERAARELGWQASTPLSEGVRRYLAWVAPERAQAAEPIEAPAADPAPAVALSRVRTGLPAWASSAAQSRPSAWIVALACFAGTVIPSMLAFRSDDFGTGQGGYVAITCLIAILAALSLLPLGPGGRRPSGGGVIAGWLLAGYVLLETVPWTRHLLNLGVPHKGTVALVAIGLAIALVVATAAMRLRDDQETAATDTVS